MEAEASQVADGPQGAASVSSHEGMSSVLDDPQAAGRSDFHDSVHVTWDTAVMNGYDGPGTGGDQLRNQGRIQIQGVRPDIDEDGYSAAQNERIGR